jgi:hypothetical protein
MYITTECHTKILPDSIEHLHHFETQWLLEATPASNLKRVAHIFSTGCLPLIRMILNNERYVSKQY